MGQPDRGLKRKFNYYDYLTWPVDERWELIDGVPYDMTPAPSTLHQQIITRLIALFYTTLKGGPCQVFGAPFDVRLPEPESDDIINVVQPDVSIICDRNKLDDRGCLGNPDLIIEVISPSTLRRDLNNKFKLYEKAGVGQYWIIYPEQKTIVVFNLNEQGKYSRPDVYCETDTVSAKIAEFVFGMDLGEIFFEI